MESTLLIIVLKLLMASDAHSAPTSTKWVLKHSAVVIKEHCCYFCDTVAVKGCYDQPNHQRRHDLAHVINTDVIERPPAYCVPSVSCTLLGSPFKSSASTKTEPELYYTIAGGNQLARGASPQPLTYTKTSATIARDTVVSVKSRAAVSLVRSKLTFQGAWLDVLGASLTTTLSNVQGKLHLVQLASGKLAVTNGALSTLDSKVFIAGGSMLAGNRANITFALSRSNDPQADPKPFIVTESSLSLLYSCITFFNHPDVFFNNAHVRMRASTLHAVNSNVRFFDTVLDLRSSEVLLENSTVWLFNTTLVQDKRVVVVKGRVPVQLNEVLGRQTRINSTPVTGLFHVSS